MDTKKAKPRVLVVEDDLAGSNLLHDGLELFGYTVDCALDGNTAVTLACTREYDAVVLDLKLPEYDGVEVLQIIRKRHLRKPVRVIVLTGDIAGTRRHDLNREGIDAYLTKPIDVVELGRYLDRITDRVRTD